MLSILSEIHISGTHSKLSPLDLLVLHGTIFQEIESRLVFLLTIHLLYLLMQFRFLIYFFGLPAIYLERRVINVKDAIDHVSKKYLNDF